MIAAKWSARYGNVGVGEDDSSLIGVSVAAFGEHEYLTADDEMTISRRNSSWAMFDNR